MANIAQRDGGQGSRTWRPTTLGKLFTRATDWSLTLGGSRYELVVAGKKTRGSADHLEHVRVELGSLWATIRLPLQGGQVVVLDGTPNKAAEALAAAIATIASELQHRRQVAEHLRTFEALEPQVVSWFLDARRALQAELLSRGWLTSEFKARHVRFSSQEKLRKLMAVPEVAAHVRDRPADAQEAVALCVREWSEVADGINARHLARELTESKAFFDTVEKSPLTEEQTRAVITLDNRVLLVASAGSGKTSTMVAKAGYVLKKGYIAPERMLLLAFNNDAAAELRERISARLKPLGLPSDKVVAKTFHAFGLDVIGAATGKRPSLAPWIESGRDLEALLAMADELKDRDPAFRTNWDLYRIVFGQDLPEFGKERDEPDAWDSEKRRQGFWTLNNEVVKSRGEQLLANFLFYNGVEYVYEAPYEHDTADSLYRQYRPDFFLPDCGAYIEHWALNEKGEPPPEFQGYKEGMAWKKELHAKHGTTLLETTVADLWSGKAFRYLAVELPKHGITLDPNPDRPAPGRQPIESPRLARTFRAFLTHTKSNRLSMAALRERLARGVAGQFRHRHEMFLSLFERLAGAWEARLAAEKCIDFDDMLNSAADSIEEGRYRSSFDLVMVDEFQDASHARARLVAGLVKEPGRHLFAVGDDWQSINRFAGADLAVMTDFEARFGRAVTLKLETTFRCPQSLCDVTSRFIEKNPKQLRKAVRSPRPNVPDPIRITRVPEESHIRTAIETRLVEIASHVPAGSPKATVYVLGRYRNDASYMPAVFDATRITVEFMTAHSSKGLEADHVILPRVTAETLGFPSGVADDPVLQLAMPSGDGYRHAEERRLFYVALTRARTSATLITIAHKESPFIAELVRNEKIAMSDLGGSVSATDLCPSCKDGFLARRSGKFGAFFGCSRFPRCTYTRNIASDAGDGGRSRSRSRRR